VTDAQKQQREFLEKQYKPDPGGSRKHFSKLFDSMVSITKHRQWDHIQDRLLCSFFYIKLILLVPC